jgi:spermidine synthase
MPRPWTIIERVETSEGPLELRRRDQRDFLITVAGRVLMNSLAHRSELLLGQLGCAQAGGRASPRVVLGGLGMGYTLRGALDSLPAGARVVVVELNPVVERWCRGPIAHLSDHALDDPRVELVNGDVARYLAQAPGGSLDAVILDLYEGPHSGTHASDDPFYGSKALRTFKKALTPRGALAVWSEQTDRGFEERLRKAGLKPELLRPGRGGLRHAVYLARC